MKVNYVAGASGAIGEEKDGVHEMLSSMYELDEMRFTTLSNVALSDLECDEG